jgi:hypothetical protein
MSNRFQMPDKLWMGTFLVLGLLGLVPTGVAMAWRQSTSPATEGNCYSWPEAGICCLCFQSHEYGYCQSFQYGGVRECYCSGSDCICLGGCVPE